MKAGKISLVWSAALLGLAVSPAAAQDIAATVKGVYLASPELCERARTEGIQAVIEEGNVLLTPRGLESIEYNCEFVQATKATRSPAWAVVAICQEPGFLFPDVLSLTEMNETQIDIVSVKADATEEGSGNSGSYHFCDGVALP